MKKNIFYHIKIFTQHLLILSNYVIFTVKHYITFGHTTMNPIHFQRGFCDYSAKTDVFKKNIASGLAFRWSDIP